jgi:GalNAc-alpha-(1->4)-GalNAc-alpha-(1->3)-diNAcBac-PP-undecaprenol alpha-1,4-N-acetyl-D-galactosaminyltransferase
LKKILIVAYSRQAGGAEKSALKLQSSLLSEAYQVEFGTFIQSNRDFYPLNSDAQSYSFFPNINRFLTRHSKYNPLILINIVRDLINFRQRVAKSKYDIVISFGAGVGCVTFVGLLGLKIFQVTSERVNPDPKIYRPSLFSQMLRPYMYKRGVVCSVQTAGFASWVRTNWAIEPVITPNYYDIPKSRYQFPQPGSPVIAVGRPAHQKGYDVLLQAWKIVENEQSRELWIVANDQEGFLANLIDKNGCKFVRVLPLHADLSALFNNCSAFISTSRFEGYPNAIAEAILYGIPVITTLSSDIVHDWEKNGICVAIPDLTPAMAARTLLLVINDEQKLEELSHKAVLCREKFSWEHNKKHWLRLIEQTPEKS